MKEAAERRVQLHVWKRKEIENYLLDATVIRRVLSKRLPASSVPSEAELRELILEICRQEFDTVVYATAEMLLSRNRGLGMTAHRIAREQVEREWGDNEKILDMAPGKAVLSKLSRSCQERYGASFGAPAIARNFYTTEIPQEISIVLEAIETGAELDQ
jgi:hypothetical protein